MTRTDALLPTRFTDAYGVRHPIACAGMAFAGMWPALPIAVAEAGALGSFGAGKLPPPAIAGAWEAISAATDAPINLNFVTMLFDDDYLALCEQLRPAVVSFHWGHPARDLIARLQGAGIRVWEQVGNAEAARRAVDDGVDLVIAQGTEAGGHNFGTLPTMVNVPTIVDAVDGALVLAAGGIMDGRGLAAALALGADGVMLGTRMVATREANVPPLYHQRMLSAAGADTVLSSLYGRDMPAFNPMRILRNPLVEEWQGREHEAPDDPSQQPVIGETGLGDMRLPIHKFSSFMPMADASGDIDSMPLLMGQGVGLVDRIEPVADVIDGIMADAVAVAGRLGAAAGRAG